MGWTYNSILRCFFRPKRGVKVGSDFSHWFPLGMIHVLVFNDFICKFQRH